MSIRICSKTPQIERFWFFLLVVKYGFEQNENRNSRIQQQICEVLLNFLVNIHDLSGTTGKGGKIQVRYM